MLIDSHCHLEYDDYLEEGLDEIIDRAKNKGVDRFLTIGTELSKFHNVLAVAEKYPEVWCSVGTHPEHAHIEMEYSRADIVKLTKHKKVVAVGEVGLDYHYGADTKAEQKACFAKHIEAAMEADLPVIIHTRDAEEDTIDIVRSIGGRDMKGVLHCFSGSMDLAKKALDLGLYISFSGIITFKNAAEVREVAAYTPMNRILVETDCPFLAPVPYRGQKNEPAYVHHTAMKLSEIKECFINEIHDRTTENFFRLFSKAER